MHTHQKTDITITDSFIQKFAKRYLEQRSQTNFDYSTLNQSSLYANLDFDTTALQKILERNAVAMDVSREKGIVPAVLNDIYRSDLGELLMTYYFEEKLPEGERFIIPLKNITFRERVDMPGRGLDAIGYKVTDDTIEILLGEAKVSAQKYSPPDVVDSSTDSIYKTHKKHRDHNEVVVQRLSEYAKRLGEKDVAILGYAIVSLSNHQSEKCVITYGCTLIRDYECVDEGSDYGKMKSRAEEFEPGKVHFSLLSFKDKTINETVDLFYKKVRDLVAE